MPESMLSWCSICGKDTRAQVLFITPMRFSNEQYTIVECPRCQGRRVLNVPLDLNKFYVDTQMRKKQNILFRFFKGLLLKKEFYRLKRELPSQSVFLDIGCGAGELSRMIHEDNSQVIAIDNSSTKPCLIASLDSIPYRSIDYQSGIIIDLPKIKHGVIILRHVLEHLPHPDLFLGALLSQGGEYFYIAVPNHGHIGDRWWGVSYGHCDPPSHLWFFNKESLNVLLTRMGLEVVRSGYETIPTIIMSMDRYCALRGMPKRYCELLFNPRGVIGLMSMIFDFLLPNNVIWVIARKRR